MALLHGRDLFLSINNKVLLDNAKFTINSRDRIALLGRNGSGKTTLLKVIMEQVVLDSGTIEKVGNVRISALLQAIPKFSKQTVRSVVAMGLGEESVLIERHQQLMLHPDKNQQALLQLQNELEATGAWSSVHRLDAILTQFNLSGETLFESLSGGLKRWTLLAQALISKPDLLLLDEPTNHLDIHLIQKLELVIKEYHGAVLFVTHDRALIRNFASSILELDRGYLTHWPGNYNHYLKAKQQIIEAEKKETQLFEKKLAAEEIWIRKGIQARRTRNEGRVRALKKLREEKKLRRTEQKKGQLTWQSIKKSGNQVILAEDICFSYNKTTIINNFSCTVLRGDKIGIVGPNGAGKSTLLKLLLQELTPSSGKVTLGVRLITAYMDQLREQLDINESARNNVTGGSDFVEINQKKVHVVTYLNDFLFTAQQSNAPVKVLSGGERNRLLLAKLFAQPANLLVLDEPTNDLDIETLELLEERCMDYPGTVLIISHDRCFLENITTQLWEVPGTGFVNEFVGGYPDWYHSDKITEQSFKEKTKKKAVNKTRNQTKLSYNEQRELKQLPKKIEALEAKELELQTLLTQGNLYKENPDQAIELSKEIKTLEASLEESYQRWEILESKTK